MIAQPTKTIQDLFDKAWAIPNRYHKQGGYSTIKTANGGLVLRKGDDVLLIYNVDGDITVQGTSTADCNAINSALILLGLPDRVELKNGRVKHIPVDPSDPLGFGRAVNPRAPPKGYVAVIRRSNGQISFTHEFTRPTLERDVIPDLLRQEPGAELLNIIEASEKELYYRALMRERDRSDSRKGMRSATAGKSKWRR